MRVWLNGSDCYVCKDKIICFRKWYVMRVLSNNFELKMLIYFFLLRLVIIVIIFGDWINIDCSKCYDGLNLWLEWGNLKSKYNFVLW